MSVEKRLKALEESVRDMEAAMHDLIAAFNSSTRTIADFLATMGLNARVEELSNDSSPNPSKEISTDEQDLRPSSNQERRPSPQPSIPSSEGPVRLDGELQRPIDGRSNFD